MNEAVVRKSRLRGPGFVLLLIALGAGAWMVLEANRPWATWVSFSSPSVAVAGRSFPVHIDLLSPVPVGRLSVDLHGRGGPSASKRAVMVGVFTGELQPEQRSYRIDIPLNSGATSRFVRAVIYLSPTGHWRDRSHSAITGDIRLLPVGSPLEGDAGRMTTQRVFELGRVSVVPRVRSGWMRLLITMLWLAALAALAVRHAPMRTPSRAPDQNSSPRRFAARWLGLAFLLAGVAEAFDISRALGDGARRLAHRLSAYEGREPGQQLVSALAITALVGTAVTLLRSRLPLALRIASAAVAGALGLVCLDSLSLHAIDAIAEGVQFGVPWIQWAHLVCASTALIGVSLPAPSPRDTR